MSIVSSQRGSIHSVGTFDSIPSWSTNVYIIYIIYVYTDTHVICVAIVRSCSEMQLPIEVSICTIGCTVMHHDELPVVFSICP